MLNKHQDAISWITKRPFISKPSTAACVAVSIYGIHTVFTDSLPQVCSHGGGVISCPTTRGLGVHHLFFYHQEAQRIKVVAKSEFMIF